MTDENEEVLNPDEDVPEELGDPAVPTELLELHLELEENGTTPEEFKEAFGNEDGN